MPLARSPHTWQTYLLTGGVPAHWVCTPLMGVPGAPVGAAPCETIPPRAPRPLHVLAVWPEQARDALGTTVETGDMLHPADAFGLVHRLPPWPIVTTVHPVAMGPTVAPPPMGPNVLPAHASATFAPDRFGADWCPIETHCGRQEVHEVRHGPLEMGSVLGAV